MKIVEAGYEILNPVFPGTDAKDQIYQMIERAGRTCYKSENSITPESAAAFVQKIVKNHHEAMLEHGSMTVRFIVDRGVSHELVRHRLASFAQESTRYCNYANGKFDGELTFIRPLFFRVDSTEYFWWHDLCHHSEELYLAMIAAGRTPQEARSILPNSLKTEVIMTANMREWRHFFRLRAAGETGAPHPQMAEVAVPLLKECQSKMPELFGDIKCPE